MEGSYAFLHRAASMPLVANALTYVNAKYQDVKNYNESVGHLVTGIESVVFRTTLTAFEMTRAVVPYHYLDELACNGLDKAENVVSFLRGSNDSKSTSTVNESKWKFIDLLQTGSHKAIDKVEEIVDVVLPSKQKAPCKESDGLWERLKGLASHTKLKVLKMGTNVAVAKGKPIDADTLSTKHVFNIIEHWLSKSYDTLKVEPNDEGAVKKMGRVFSLTLAGTMLTTMGAVEATIPRVRTLSMTIMVRAKTAAQNTINLTLKTISDFYSKSKRIITDDDFVKSTLPVLKETPRNVLATLKSATNTTVNLADQVFKEIGAYGLDKNFKKSDTSAGTATPAVIETSSAAETKTENEYFLRKEIPEESRSGSHAENDPTEDMELSKSGTNFGEGLEKTEIQKQEESFTTVRASPNTSMNSSLESSANFKDTNLSSSENEQPLKEGSYKSKSIWNLFR